MTHLNHRQYQEVARKLMNMHYALPNPLSLNSELVSIGLRLKALCNFTLWIADPTWKEPGNAASGAAFWTYAQLIGDMYNPLPAVQDPNAESVEGAVTQEQYDERVQANKAQGEFYTQQLRKHIIGNLKVYASIPEVCGYI